MQRLHANLLLLVAALIWGVTFAVQKMAMGHIEPILFTGFRFILGALVVLPFAWREGRTLAKRTRWRLTGSDLAWLGLTGSMLFFGALFQQIGIKDTSVANAGFLTALYVPLTPIFVFLVWRKVPHRVTALSALACLGGAYLMAGASLDTIKTGDLWVIAGAVFWAIHILLIGAMTARVGAPFVISAVQFTVVGVLGLSLGGILETLDWSGFVNALPMILFSGILSVGTGFTLQVVAQRHTPAADAAVILSAETVFSALAGMILLGEQLSSTEWLGGVLIFAGVLAVELVPLIRTKKPTKNRKQLKC